MGASAKTAHTAVAARTESGRLCSVMVQQDPLGRHLLRYEGTETAVAMLTPEVVELLTVALSVRGRSVIPARSPLAGACTLLVIGQQGRASLYFHASNTTSAVLDTAGIEKLRSALELLSGVGMDEGP